MAHSTTILINGVTNTVTEFDHTAQEIDDAVGLLGNVSDAGAVLENLHTDGHKNLLHNWNFCNPVNQRGQSSYSCLGSGNVNIYTIDRWKFRSSNSSNDLTITPGTDGLYFNFAVRAGGHYGLYQTVDPIYYNLLAGKEVTFSVQFTENTNAFRLRVFDDATELARTDPLLDPDGIASLTLTLPASPTSLQFGIYNQIGGATVKVQKVKLEFGDTSTLAADAYPDYSMQLLECQRYQMVVVNGSFTYAGFGAANDATTALIALTMPVKMRMANPTVVINDLFLRDTGGGACAVSAITPYVYDTSLTLVVTSSGLTPGAAYLLGGMGTVGTFILDANL